MKRLRSLASQSPALIISMAALFFSLGSGASYAATRVSDTHAVKPHGVHVTWTDLSLTNGWVSSQDEFNSGDPRYGANGSGVIYLSGSLHAPEADAIKSFAQLPRGNRPLHVLYLPIYTYLGALGSLAIEPNGKMYLAGGENTIAYSSLAGVSFPLGS